MKWVDFMGRLKDKLLQNRAIREQHERNVEEQTVEPIQQITPEQQQLAQELQQYQQQQQQYDQYQQQYQQQYPEYQQYTQPEQYPPDQSQQYQSMTPYDAHLQRLAQLEQEGSVDVDSPLSILDEIKEKPAPKGVFPVIIGGRPLDLHALEDYVVKISPFSLKTVLRYHNARTIEEIKGYGRGPNVKLKGGMIMFILFAVAMAALGIFVIMFMPDLMSSFSSGGGLIP